MTGYGSIIGAAFVGLAFYVLLAVAFYIAIAFAMAVITIIVLLGFVLHFVLKWLGH